MVSLGGFLVGAAFGWQFVAVLSLVAAMAASTPLKQVVWGRFWLWTLLTLITWRAWHLALEACGRSYAFAGYGLMIAFSLIIFCRASAMNKGNAIVES